MKKTVVVFLILLTGCSRNESLIKGRWAYQEGYHISDSLDFETNVEVRNDTVFQDSKALARFIKIRVGFFGIPPQLQISDLKADKVGIYVGQ